MPILDVYISKDLKERVNQLSLEERRDLGDALRSLIRRKVAGETTMAANTPRNGSNGQESAPKRS